MLLILSGSWRDGEMAGAAIGIGSGLAVAFLVYRLARRVPWPQPFRLRFLALHLVGAPAASMAWYALSIMLERILIPSYRHQFEARAEMHLFVGIIFYAIVVGVAHAE